MDQKDIKISNLESLLNEARSNTLLTKLAEESSVDEPEGTKLPEGTQDKDAAESNPTVETNDVLDTQDTAEDVEGLDNKDLTLTEDDECCEMCKDEGNGKGIPDNGEIENKNTPGELTGVATTDAKNMEEYNEKAKEDEEDAKGIVQEQSDYHSLKEAISLGADRFASPESQAKLKSQVAVLLAKENNDLLYEEYSRLASEAAAVRAAIEKKYSVISNNRVGSLLESMNAVEANIAKHKDDMFKKLNEQKELNKAIKEAKTLSADELAFND